MAPEKHSSPVRIVLRMRPPRHRRVIAPQEDGDDGDPTVAGASECDSPDSVVQGQTASRFAPGARAIKHVHKLQHKLQLLHALRSTVKQLVSERKRASDGASVRSASVDEMTADMYEVGSHGFSAPLRSCESATLERKMEIEEADVMSDFGSVMRDFGTDDKYAMLEELSSVAPEVLSQCADADEVASWNSLLHGTMNSTNSSPVADTDDSFDFEEKKVETEENRDLVKVAKKIHSDFMDTVVIDAQQRAKVLVLQILGSEGVEAVCLGPQQTQQLQPAESCGHHLEQESLKSTPDDNSLRFFWYMERLASEIEVAVEKEETPGQRRLESLSDQAKASGQSDDGLGATCDSKLDDGDKTVRTDVAVQPDEQPVPVLVMSPSGVMSNFDDGFDTMQEKPPPKQQKLRRRTKVGFVDSVLEGRKDDQNVVSLEGVALTRTTNFDKHGEAIHVDDSENSDDSAWTTMQRNIQKAIGDKTQPDLSDLPSLAGKPPRGYARKRTGSFASGTTADSYSMGLFPVDDGVLDSDELAGRNYQKKPESLVGIRSVNSNVDERSIGSFTDATRSIRSFGDRSYGSYDDLVDLQRLSSDVRTISSEYTSYDDDSIKSEGIPNSFSCSDEITEIAQEISTKGPGVVSKWLVPV